MVAKRARKSFDETTLGISIAPRGLCSDAFSVTLSTARLYPQSSVLHREGGAPRTFTGMPFGNGTDLLHIVLVRTVEASRRSFGRFGSAPCASVFEIEGACLETISD